MYITTIKGTYGNTKVDLTITSDVDAEKVGRAMATMARGAMEQYLEDTPGVLAKVQKQLPTIMAAIEKFKAVVKKIIEKSSLH